MTIELALLSRVAYRGAEIAGARVRGLLALLAGDPGTGCSTARLLDGLWPHEQPAHPTKALQILVSRARTTLGPDLIQTTPTGYRLSLGEDQVDASAVLRHASASSERLRAGDHVAALAHAEAGLALWEGAPEPDGTLDDPVAALRAARAPVHGSLRRDRALALARLGRRAEAREPLARLHRESPRDEEVLLELLRSEAATAGPAAALATYEAYRGTLRDDLGTDPGAALQALHGELLRSALPAVRHGVAHEPNPLLGRDDDVTAVTALLRASRVTSIVGPGGSGKTRLAHAVGRAAEQRVVHLVALAAAATDDDVVAQVAAALGAAASWRPPAATSAAPVDSPAGIASALGSGPALLVLDNCEHVVRGVAELVRVLVALTNDARVLTTSRAPLGLSSESVYPLPVLPLKTMVELFSQRARAARPDVDLPADVVEQVCRRLDGLPLAAELAAARIRTMSATEIARGLQDRFGLLRGGAVDAPERHRTLHAVVDWSWALLDADGQTAMRALSVFPAGFTVETAVHLLGADGTVQVLEDLVDQSLLQVDETTSGTRFSILEAVREFSSERRAAAGETDRVLDGLLAWARDFGTAYHERPFGSDPGPPLDRIRAEQDNLATALRHGLDRADAATVAATTAVLGGLWIIESDYTRLGGLVQDAATVLSDYRPEGELVEVARTALMVCTLYAVMVGGPRLGRSLAALRRLPPAPPTTLSRAAAIVLSARPGEAAALRALRDADEPLVAAIADSIASYRAESQGDMEGALLAAERMLAALEEQRVPWVWALTNARISELCLQLEDAARARRHLLAALRVAERLGLTSDVLGFRWWLVLANLQLGDLDEAERWLEQGAPNATDQHVFNRTYGLGVRAEIMLARGEVEAGLGLWRRAVERLRHADDTLVGVDSAGLGMWAAEAEAVAVVAHAQHRRLDLVAGIVSELPRRLSGLLTNPTASQFLAELPVCGALLLALAMVDLARGASAHDDRLVGSGARMVALAERCRFLRGFQPTMSSARAHDAAKQADGSAYDDAMSAYAGLDHEELRAAATAALQERDRR